MLIRATKYSAGYDITAPYDLWINGNEPLWVDTEETLQMPHDQFGLVLPRSSLSREYTIMLLGPHVIDADFSRPFSIGLFRPIPGQVLLTKGSRIAQIVFLKREHYQYATTHHVDREGGFGSTGA